MCRDARSGKASVWSFKPWGEKTCSESYTIAQSRHSLSIKRSSSESRISQVFSAVFLWAALSRLHWLFVNLASMCASLKTILPEGFNHINEGEYDQEHGQYLLLCG